MICSNLFKINNGETKVCNSMEYFNGKPTVWLCGRCMEEKRKELAGDLE